MTSPTCIVIEDEPLALEKLCSFVRRTAALQLIAAFDNAPEALTFLEGHHADVVFLDVRLGECSGLELLERRAIRSRVVLTTAYPQFAARAYDLDVVDYLVKPYTFERFAKAVERVSAVALATPPADSIFVKSGPRLERIRLDDVLLIEGQRDYRRIHLASDRRIMTPQTFGAFERQLPAERICRVHKSFMVALDRITSVERAAVTVDGISVPVSDTYKERLFELLRAMRSQVYTHLPTR